MLTTRQGPSQTRYLRSNRVPPTSSRREFLQAEALLRLSAQNQCRS